MPRRYGKAAITWTSTDANSERVHWLQMPLQEVQPSHTQAVYAQESLDKSVIESFSVGAGAHEFSGTARFDNDPQGLVELIAEGSKNTTLTYYPNIEDSEVSFACKLIAPRAEAVAGLDPQRAKFGEHAVMLRLRQTDESAFRSEFFRNTNTLFRYRAGDSLEDATFARADTAVRVTKGWGTLSNTTNAKTRTEWVSTEGSSGYRDTPALLLETGRTNGLLYSEDFSQWRSTGDASSSTSRVTLTAGQADPYGSTNAWLLAGITTSEGHLTATISTSIGVPQAISLYMKEGTSAAAGGCAIQVFDTTGSGARLATQVTWSSGIPTVTYVTGSSFSEPERMRNGYWRIKSVTTTGGSADATMWITPKYNNGQTGDVYIFGAVAE